MGRGASDRPLHYATLCGFGNLVEHLILNRPGGKSMQ
jgi:hypothetical protein